MMKAVDFDIGRIRALIFDLDGVVLSTDHYHERAWASLAEDLGIDFSLIDSDRLRGVSRLQCVDVLLERYRGGVLSDSERIALGERKNTLYRSLVAEMSPSDVADEVRDSLRELRRRGYRLAIGSVSRNARYILERTEMLSFFDALADGTITVNAKPDPEVFLHAARMLDTPPEHCAVIEDAVSGLEAARRGGMLPIGIGPAATSALAVLRISSLTELLEIYS